MGNPLEMALQAGNKREDNLSLEALGNVVETTLKDLKFRLKSLGIKFPLESAEEVAGRPIEILNSRVAGLVDELDRETVEGLKRGLMGVGTLAKEAQTPNDVLKGFEKQSDKLVDKVANAREQNVRSYLRLRELRQNKDLTDLQRAELKKLFNRQIEVSRLLKQPDLENHLGRLLDNIKDLIAGLEREMNTPLKPLSDDEVKQIMSDINNGSGTYIFTPDDVRRVHISRHQRRLELMDFQITELKKAKDEVVKYSDSKNGETV